MSSTPPDQPEETPVTETADGADSTTSTENTGDNLTQALALVDQAEAALEKIRLETPIDYFDTDEGRGNVTGQMRQIDEEYLEAAMRLMVVDPPLPAEDWNTFGERFSRVNRMFSFIAGEKDAGRLPMLKEAPWPPDEMTVEDNMRADAADAEAEPAVNGYQDEEAPDAQGADDHAEA